MSHRVAFLGFSDFERSALSSCFRLAEGRMPKYELVATLTDADFLVADADHGPSVALVNATDRLAETVFVGSAAPAGACAWTTRPIDALHVMRELDALVGAADGPSTSPAIEPAGEPATAPAAHAQAGAPPGPAALAGAPARADEAAAPAAAARAAAGPAPGASPPLVLLVDDSEIARRYLELRLAPYGLVAHHAATSQAAEKLLARHSYRLVFIDVELGDESSQDGLSLCQQITHSGAALEATAIIVSAHATELDRARGMLAGCNAYLGKPLDEAELHRVLHRQGLRLPGQEQRARAPR